MVAPAASEVNVPTLVSDDAVTPLASVAPVSVPAGATTTAVDAAVMRPLALTVKVGIAVEDPKLPTLLLTVARVVVREPAVVVMSPVNAGNDAAVRVPTTSARLIFNVEVATQDGAPVVKDVWRIVPPVEEASFAKLFAPVAYIVSPAVYVERPVPPFAGVRADARERTPVEEKEEVAVEPKYPKPAEMPVEEA